MKYILFKTGIFNDIRARAQHFLQDCINGQRRHRAVCASEQTDQSLRSPPEDAVGTSVPIECLAKTLIILCRCAGWSDSSLGAGIAVVPLI